MLPSDPGERKLTGSNPCILLGNHWLAEIVGVLTGVFYGPDALAMLLHQASRKIAHCFVSLAGSDLQFKSENHLLPNGRLLFSGRFPALSLTQRSQLQQREGAKQKKSPSGNGLSWP